MASASEIERLPAGDLSSTNQSNTSFTLFPNLPPELRDKIWDEALKEWTVLFIHFKWNTGVQGFRRFGFNPISVALSCRDAAARWRVLYPRHTLARSLVPTPPLNADFTILFAPALHLEYFLESERPETFERLHLAVQIPDMVMMVNEAASFARLLGSLATRDTIANTRQVVIGKWEVDLHVTVDPTIQTFVGLYPRLGVNTALVNETIIDVVSGRRLEECRGYVPSGKFRRTHPWWLESIQGPVARYLSDDEMKVLQERRS